jgi:hypothetical protein
MSILIWIQAAFALALTATAAWTDYRTGLIPNRLTLSSIAMGLVLAAVGGGGRGILLAAAGAFSAGLVPLVLFRMKAMGGSDSSGGPPKADRRVEKSYPASIRDDCNPNESGGDSSSTTIANSDSCHSHLGGPLPLDGRDAETRASRGYPGNL